MTDDYVRRIREHVAEDFPPACVAHDLPHLDRVWRNCQLISAAEGGDPVVLGGAAYLHDYHRVVELRTGSWVSPEQALEPVAQTLTAVGFPRELRGRVIACVIATDTHAFAGDQVADGLEERVVRDADALDAMGAVGIARAFMFGGKLGEPMWRPEVAAAPVYRPGEAASVVHHFHEKLLRLRDDMATAAGRALAGPRHDVMVEFLRQLAAESGDSTSAGQS